MAQPAIAHGVTSPELLEETIDQNLKRTVARWPDREAIVVRHQSVRWSYREFDLQIDQVAKGLIALGIERGDRVALWSPNRIEWVLIQYATARIGAIMVCVNPAYRTVELKYVLQQSGARMIATAPQFKTSNYKAQIAEVHPELPDLEHTVIFGESSWDAMLKAGNAIEDKVVATRAASLSNTEAINIQYTSGTTGLPKGATLTHRNILNNGFFVAEGCGYTHEDRVCIPVPLYHCFGMVMGNIGSTTHGACMVFPGESFEPRSVLETVAEERCTSLYGVPTMFIAQMAQADFDSFDLGSLRTGIMAGSICPIEVMKQVIERMHMDGVTICYGMTETSPVSTQTAADDSLQHRTSSVGRVHPHVEIRIANPETNETVNRGESGEFQTRGYSVMQGYWNDPEKTAAAIDEEGWMHTGDVAVMDEDGYIDITGRIKDLIIRGGENISPREIEDYLFTSKEVADVQVVGVPDTKYGEEVCAFVRAADGEAPTEASIREFCVGNIAHFKVPRYVVVVDEFPMTVTGKIQKYRLREIAEEKFILG
ncbi:AMP-binding protein [Chromatiales bacterium (ex Bugula neritina AB1)]|nr:AMP-binding protein [Chromatiales bacterium (ex Bugula neritina AB1)]